MKHSDLLTEQQLEELSWQDVKQGAKKGAAAIGRGLEAGARGAAKGAGYLAGAPAALGTQFQAGKQTAMNRLGTQQQAAGNTAAQRGIQQQPTGNTTAQQDIQQQIDQKYAEIQELQRQLQQVPPVQPSQSQKPGIGQRVGSAVSGLGNIASAVTKAASAGVGQGASGRSLASPSSPSTISQPAQAQTVAATRPAQTQMKPNYKSVNGQWVQSSPKAQPSNTKVVSGGPTPAEQANLEKRIQAASQAQPVAESTNFGGLVWMQMKGL